MTDQEGVADAVSREDSTPILRIANILKERVKVEGSYSKLEDAIRWAHPEWTGEEELEVDGDGKKKKPPIKQHGTPLTLDRRKLKSIVENDPKLVLSVGELRALDYYLERYGHGFGYNPFFEKPDVVRVLAQSKKIAFLLGSKRDQKDRFRINISHWDVLGLNEIQSGILGCSQDVRIDIREVRMPDDEKAALAELKLTGGDRYPHDYFSSQAPSLVVLGSSRGTHVAEWMLCRMFGEIPEFTKADPEDRVALPFHFVWSKKHPYVLPSAFHLDGKDAKKEDSEAGHAVLEDEAACLRYGGKYAIDKLSQRGFDEGDTYAVCVAQRRADGQIWLLVAGLTGPGTVGGAGWVHKMATRLYDGRGRSPVFWNIVKAHAAKDGDTYRVGEAEFVAGGAWP